MGFWKRLLAFAVKEAERAHRAHQRLQKRRALYAATLRALAFPGNFTPARWGPEVTNGTD